MIMKPGRHQSANRELHAISGVVGHGCFGLVVPAVRNGRGRPKLFKPWLNSGC